MRVINDNGQWALGRGLLGLALTSFIVRGRRIMGPGVRLIAWNS